MFLSCFTEMPEKENTTQTRNHKTSSKCELPVRQVSQENNKLLRHCDLCTSPVLAIFILIIYRINRLKGGKRYLSRIKGAKMVTQWAANRTTRGTLLPLIMKRELLIKGIWNHYISSQAPAEKIGFIILS